MESHRFTTVQSEIRSHGAEVLAVFFSYFHTHCLLTGPLAQRKATFSVLYIAFLFCLLCMLIYKHVLAVLMNTLHYHIYIGYAKTHLCLYEITEVVNSMVTFFYTLTS